MTHRLLEAADAFWRPSTMLGVGMRELARPHALVAWPDHALGAIPPRAAGRRNTLLTVETGRSTIAASTRG